MIISMLVYNKFFFILGIESSFTLDIILTGFRNSFFANFFSLKQQKKEAQNSYGSD